MFEGVKLLQVEFQTAQAVKSIDKAQVSREKDFLRHLLPYIYNAYRVKAQSFLT